MMDKETVIKRMNDCLAPEEAQLIASLGAPGMPVIFIVGLPRSGTTLLLQLLIRRYRLGYIDNLTARFWEAPVIGASLAFSLNDRRDTSGIALNSSFGFTEGQEGPHEFGYFWRRFFPFEVHHELGQEALEKVDISLLRREIAGLEQVFQSPVVFKNAAALPLQTAFLSRALPTSVFLYIEREPEAVAASILHGRKKYSGDIENWFSIKPRHYEDLLHLPVYEQVAGQVFFTRNEIRRQLSEIAPDRRISVRYRDLCREPGVFFAQFEELMGRHGTDLVRLDPLLPDLKASDPSFEGPEERRAMLEALKKWDVCE